MAISSKSASTGDESNAKGVRVGKDTCRGTVFVEDQHLEGTPPIGHRRYDLRLGSGDESKP